MDVHIPNSFCTIRSRYTTECTEKVNLLSIVHMIILYKIVLVDLNAASDRNFISILLHPFRDLNTLYRITYIFNHAHLLALPITITQYSSLPVARQHVVYRRL